MFCLFLLQYLFSGLVGRMTMACSNGLPPMEKQNIWITHDGSMDVHINTMQTIVRCVLIWIEVRIINGLYGIVIRNTNLSAKSISDISFAIIVGHLMSNNQTRVNIIYLTLKCLVGFTIHRFDIEIHKDKGITKRNIEI